MLQQPLYADVGINLLLVDSILLSENPLFQEKWPSTFVLKEWEEEKEQPEGRGSHQRGGGDDAAFENWGHLRKSQHVKSWVFWNTDPKEKISVHEFLEAYLGSTPIEEKGKKLDWAEGDTELQCNLSWGPRWHMGGLKQQKSFRDVPRWVGGWAFLPPCWLVIASGLICEGAMTLGNTALFSFDNLQRLWRARDCLQTKIPAAWGCKTSFPKGNLGVEFQHPVHGLIPTVFLIIPFPLVKEDEGWD